MDDPGNQLDNFTMRVLTRLLTHFLKRLTQFRSHWTHHISLQKLLRKQGLVQ